jgi:hypothetical protein
MMSSGFRVLHCEGGDFLYKGSGFPLFCFYLSPLLSHQTLCLLYHPFNMTSYTEDILCMARDASGPSIRDMEVIQSFQSCPTTKDAVSVLSFLL